LANFRDIGRFFIFIIGGLVAVIVGAFMLRGNMHLWDKKNSEDGKD